ncbi:hypothetical protein ANCCEY_01427 [Ancylostoma ceylanicum]|uniref:Uncharacterized protein n=1 Tax=Ancylostoma ceylanicum TaxID=53326 RepID=A0A0D6M5T8_9BILA|nr:hypothetical protein ANCCEY_01427 [Ancylostoma ceylanicum]
MSLHSYRIEDGDVLNLQVRLCRCPITLSGPMQISGPCSASVYVGQYWRSSEKRHRRSLPRAGIHLGGLPGIECFCQPSAGFPDLARAQICPFAAICTADTGPLKRRPPAACAHDGSPAAFIMWSINYAMNGQHVARRRHAAHLPFPPAEPVPFDIRNGRASASWLRKTCFGAFSPGLSPIIWLVCGLINFG